MTAAEYSEWLEAGWRRFGHVLFRPACPLCRKCQSLRVPVDAFGKSFLHHGRTFTVIGLELKRNAKPVLMRRDDGKQFVFPSSFFQPTTEVTR